MAEQQRPGAPKRHENTLRTCFSLYNTYLYGKYSFTSNACEWLAAPATSHTRLLPECYGHTPCTAFAHDAPEPNPCSFVQCEHTTQGLEGSAPIGGLRIHGGGACTPA